MPKIVSDPLRVLRFVKQYSHVLASEGMQGLGLEKDGELIAGVIFDGYSGKSMWIHVAAVPGRHWLNRSFLRACFGYVFEQVGCEKLFGWVPASNSEAQRFDEHLGFKQVATIPGAAVDGGDVLIYVMDRAECRFLGHRFMEQAYG
jgi:RimJ/RimL family protein N-acetyltransferase